MRIRKIATAGAVALTTAVASLTFATQAQAAQACPDYYACLWYNSDWEGAIYVSADPVADYTGKKFVTSAYTNGSNGAGLGVKNNSASAYNADPDYRFRVYYNSNFNGTYAYQTFSPLSGGNFTATMKNQNASGQWIGW
ncbi:peptidase inhibitor family I36 protein [Actinacidiphila glaucinigra]|uniref:peptidase inhibitor family I36 protein n=1 Tax=Actinacidiphila glaucinigra TaxID=235986 RepID=UPI0037143FED